MKAFFLPITVFSSLSATGRQPFFEIHLFGRAEPQHILSPSQPRS